MTEPTLAQDSPGDHPPPPERTRCAACGEPGGSVSAGTGRPLMRDADGELRHVTCGPIAPASALDAMMGGAVA